MDLSERKHGDASLRHPWETSRASFLRRLIRRHGPSRPTLNWLDVGAGDAWFAVTSLDDVSVDDVRLTCWDEFYSEQDLGSLRSDHPDVTFRRDRPEGRFDLITMLDVLEHVEHDQQFLNDAIEACLDPGGVVVVTVPAYQRLYTRHDEALRHHRRYDPARIRSVLVSAGLRIEVEGGLFSSLLPVRASQKLAETARPGERQHGVGGWSGGPVLTRAITAVLDADARLSERVGNRGRYLPGLSYWAVCVRS